MLPNITPPATAERQRPHTPQRTATVCVVDPRFEDYSAWQHAAEEGGAQVRFFAQAADALRFARTAFVDLWVVNVNLPGLSGYELCDMLKAQSSRTAVYLVADDYSAAAEQSAWAHRATLFGAKPAHESWLDLWLAQRTARPTHPESARCSTC